MMRCDGSCAVSSLSPLILLWFGAPCGLAAQDCTLAFVPDLVFGVFHNVRLFCKAIRVESASAEPQKALNAVKCHNVWQFELFVK